MAWLLIDSCERTIARFALIPPTGEIQVKTVEGKRVSLCSEIDAFISPSELDHLEGVGVVYGPGSFSAVRSGVIIANLLSRLYHIPLYGFTREEAMNLIDVRRQLVAGSKAASPYVSPLYDAEPNITVRS